MNVATLAVDVIVQDKASRRLRDVQTQAEQTGQSFARLAAAASGALAAAGEGIPPGGVLRTGIPRTDQREDHPEAAVGAPAAGLAPPGAEAAGLFSLESLGEAQEKIATLKDAITSMITQAEDPIEITIQDNGEIKKADTELNKATRGRQVTVGVSIKFLGDVTAVQEAAKDAAVGSVAGDIKNIPEFAGGGFTGRGAANQIAGVVHPGEYVVPHNGALVLRDGRRSAGGLHINTVNVYGVQDVEQLYTQLQREADRRKT